MSSIILDISGMSYGSTSRGCLMEVHRRHILITFGYFALTSLIQKVFPFQRPPPFQAYSQQTPETTSPVNPYTEKFRVLLKQQKDQPIQQVSLKSWEPIRGENLEIEKIPFEIPVITDLPNNSVCMYLPGAAEIRSAQCMNGILDYFYQFLLAKGIPEEQAKDQISRLKTNIKLTDRINYPQDRLSAQLHIMKTEGLYIIPWEFFDKKERLPYNMALAAEGLIKTFNQNTPIVVMGHSLGGLSLRVLLKMYQSGLIDQSRPIKGGIFISEGYYGDVLSTILYAFKRQLFRFILNDDTNTGNLALTWLNKVKTNIQTGFLNIEQIIENALGSDVSIPISTEINSAITGLINTFKNDPASLGQILRLTVHSLVPPRLITGLSGVELQNKGCTITGVRSLQDPHSFLAQILGIKELLVEKNPQRVLQVTGHVPSNNSIPRLPENGFNLDAHEKYPQVAKLLIGT